MHRAIMFACTIGAAAVALNVEPAPAAEPQPGLWEIHKSFERGGTSTQRPVRTRCVSADQASQLARLPSDNVKVGPATCRSFALRKMDNGTTWTTLCPSLPFRFEASYVAETPQHYTWTFRREIILAGQPVAASTIVIEGKRVGECPK